MQNEYSGPETITLTNHKCRRDYHDYLETVLDYQEPQDTIWEYDGKFYTLTELCKGFYQSGKKQGQQCMKIAYTRGYCSQHISQDRARE